MLPPGEAGPLRTTDEPPVYLLVGTERQAADWLASVSLHSQPDQDAAPRTIGDRTAEAGGYSSPSVRTSPNTTYVFRNTNLASCTLTSACVPAEHRP